MAGSVEPNDAPTAVHKALAVLETFAYVKDGWLGVADVARRVALPKSTAHRILRALSASGFLESSNGRYRLGKRALEIGSAAQAARFGSLADTVQLAMEALFNSVRQTVSLGLLDRGDVVVIERIVPSGGNAVTFRQRARVPASCSAMGKAILAFNPPHVIERAVRPSLTRLTPHSLRSAHALLEQLSEVRRQHVAYEFEEARLGMVSVAAPILDDRGRAIAAIAASGMARSFEPHAASVSVISAARQSSLAIASTP